MKKVLLLGASGSIGTQSLDIIEAHPDRFTLTGFSLGKRVGMIPDFLKRFPSVQYLCVSNAIDAENLRKTYPNLKVFHGDEGLVSIIKECPSDMVINALVGFAGLVPSVTSLEENKILCLANKESLVVGGSIINGLLAEGKGKLWPIDSEHVAIAKLLSCIDRHDLKRVLITASGGSFRKRNRAELVGVTKEDALAHPTWSMGAKITIDSATMMNKGFEIIEADVLFGIGVDHVTPLMHDESYVHSLIELQDGTLLADVSKPDMHGPIEYALMEGDVPFTPVKGKCLADYQPYHFHDFDPQRYPAVPLALASHRRGGNSNAILNAANEIAVYAFLEGKLSFLSIEEEVRYALDTVPFIEKPTLKDLLLTDKLTREAVSNHIGG
ncbi:MAG: 1-deoxy-D-xylulose-5-phosphate reductoisomerase [Bacilli bacterium]|nr:1-deoxy-D-xylulose-5-phosphate reductoisomerase [Bacilli bacterium]